MYIDAASVTPIPMYDKAHLTWTDIETPTTQCAFQGVVAVDTTGYYFGTWVDSGADTQGMVFSVFEASGALIKSYDVFGTGLGGLAVDVEITSQTGMYFGVHNRGDSSHDNVYVQHGRFSCKRVLTTSTTADQWASTLGLRAWFERTRGPYLATLQSLRQQAAFSRVVGTCDVPFPN